MSALTAPVIGKELGTLAIVVLKARNLHDKHTVTKQDPFVVVQMGNMRKNTGTDKRGGQHPVWDQDLQLPIPSSASKETRTLKIFCYAKESKGDDLIGSGEVDISELLVTGEFDDWVKLEEKGIYRGEVYLELTFFAAGPRPLSGVLDRRPSKLPQSERLWRPPQTPTKISPHKQAPNLPSLPNTQHTIPVGPLPGSSHFFPPKPIAVGMVDSQPPLPSIPISRPEPSTEIPFALRPGGPHVHGAPTSVPTHNAHNPSGAGIAQHPSTCKPVQRLEVKAYEPISFPEPRTPPYHGERNSGFENTPEFPASYHPSRPETESFRRYEPKQLDAHRVDINPTLDDPYIEKEREVLARTSQEEADEELARYIAQNEGIDVNRLRTEEADHELARKLAMELNSKILQDSKSIGPIGSENRRPVSNHMPGRWQ